jgi:hypothetical protein
MPSFATRASRRTATVAALFLTALTPVATSAHAATTVDLVVRADQPAIAPGATGIQQLLVSNSGQTTTGDVVVSFVTPAYTNIDRTTPLPAGCVMRYSDPDPTIPEVVNCTLAPGLAAGTTATLAMPLQVTTRARLSGPSALDVVSAVPAANSADREVNLNNNWTATSILITRPTPAMPQGNNINLYLTHDVPVATAAHTASVTLTYGNAGPESTLGPVQATVVTPFYTTVDLATPLPSPCHLALTDDTIATPEIVVCTLDPLAKNAQQTLTIPLKTFGTAIAGKVLAPALISPVQSSDVDIDQTDNLDSVGVLLPSSSR